MVIISLIMTGSIIGLSSALAGSPTASTLRIALIHFDAKFKDPTNNLQRLTYLNRKAAEGGAAIILNTELAVTGYSFQSRKDIAPFTETDNGKTIHEMSKLAKEYGVYIGITFPERDAATQIYYNSAFVLGPNGKQVCKYHKVESEKRWARSGGAFQKGEFDTPWGRMGVLICADSHNSLMPRLAALKDVNLLWVPANWPPTFGLDPQLIWRARAFENGFFLAACNRTGIDRITDFSKAASCVFDPKGNQLFSGTSETSQVFFTELPLNAEGRFTDTHRREMLSTRKVNQYRPIYLEPWVENLTLFYKLPKPGVLNLHCYIPPSNRINLGELEACIEQTTSPHPALWVLPETPSADVKIDALTKIALNRKVAFAVSFTESDGQPVRMLITPDGNRRFSKTDAAEKKDFPFEILHYGPAAITMVGRENFRHPELAVTLSKLGCDLVILSEDRMSPEDLLVSRVKALTGLAVAACSKNGAEITCMLDLHGSCDQRRQYEPGVCSYGLDTSNTRKKRFQNRIDFDLLLKKK